jgi:hypothetical protein
MPALKLPSLWNFLNENRLLSAIVSTTLSVNRFSGDREPVQASNTSFLL